MLIAVLFTIAAAGAPVQPQPEPTPQKLFEAGKIQEAIDSIRKRPEPSHDLTYLRALAHKKLDQNDDAKEAFRTLTSAGDDSAWKAIGTSGAELMEGNLEAADAAARKAVEQDAGLPLAHYQLGLVESARGNQAPAALAF